MTNPLQIAPETFVALGRNKYGYEVGTVEVRGQTVPAVRHDDGELVISGFVGRYRTSTNPWPANVWIKSDGGTYARFGRDDRSGRFQKLRGISFEPKTYETLTNAAYWTVA